MVTDESLLKWYVKGFNDELNGSSTVESDNELENTAYSLGAASAIAGDDVSSVDLMSDEEILKMIKEK